MKWARLALLGLLGLLFCFVVSGCGSVAADKQADSKLPSKIIIGLDDNFPPMGFRNKKGQLIGFDIDMAREAARRAHMDVEFKTIDWDSKELELMGHHIDVLWNGLTITPEREKKILFSIPYLDDKQLIVVRANSPIQTKAQLAGKIVGTQQGSTGETVLEKDPFTKKIKEVKKYSDFISGFMDLEVGRIDALVVDGVVGQYTMNKKPGVFRALKQTYGSDYDAVGFRKDDVVLQQKINEVLREMMADGTVDRLAMKWFGSTDLINKKAFEEPASK